MTHVFFDLETTSAEPGKCRIVEMCFAGLPSEHDALPEILLHALVDPPHVPIADSATAVHGITKDHLIGEQPFDHYADQVQSIIDGAILVGFNNIHFDSVVLDRELMAAGLPGLEKDEYGIICHPEIDLFAIWKEHERRTLSTAAKRFAGEDLEDAHSADADVLILSKIMKGMRIQLGHEGLDYVKMSKPAGAIDREGKFVKREDGTIIFNFGKHKDEPVRSGRNYLEWMLSASFSPEVQAYCKRFLAGDFNV